MVTKRIIVGLLLVTGCTAEASGARRDAPHGSSEDTRGAELPAPPPEVQAPSMQAPSAVPEADVPLLAWSFEPASPDCNGWPVLGADAIRASPARSGAYSCKICSDGTAEGVGLSRDVGAVPAGRYVLTAYVRKRIQNAAPGEALAKIEARTEGGHDVSAVAPSVAVRYEWDRLEATLDLTEGASNLRLTIGAPTAEADHCLFVDDVTVVRQK